MRVFRRLAMATPTKMGAAASLQPALDTLLPPIPLYRRCLRANRKLPPDMRVLGDGYLKAEFRNHQNIDNPLHIVGFLTQWQLYAQEIEGDTWREGKLDPSQMEKLSDQQLGQLYELMKATREGSDGEN